MHFLVFVFLPDDIHQSILVAEDVMVAATKSEKYVPGMNESIFAM